jgi:cyclopropane-fatty-acyl-phospholipid synthase
MEVTRTVAKSLVELSGLTRFQKLVLGSLMKMRKGRLIITLPNGQALSIGDTDEIQASIHIKNNDFFKRCALYGDVGFGESYVAGDWDTDSIANVIKFMILNIEDSEHLSGGKGKRFFINPMEFVKPLPTYHE